MANKGGKQLLVFTSWRELQKVTYRRVCKVPVELDRDLKQKLENYKLKPRQHTGIIKNGRIALPTYISQALQKIIGDHPTKVLLKNCKNLNQYIVSRHPPVEQEEIQLKMKKITSEAEECLPLENFTQLNEDEKQKFKRERNKFIERRLAERTYLWKPLTYGPYEALVYAIGRGALEYSVLTTVLREIMIRDFQFKPRSYFDFGSGIGSGMWAASLLWKDSIFEYYNVDSSRDMHDISELILRDGNENQEIRLRNVFYRQFLPALETKYDLVLSSYSLFELSSSENRKKVLLNLWRKCDKYFVIIEEGTRRGFELVNEAKEFILDLNDGHVFAPCPHNNVCPRITNVNDRTPCNFEVKYTPLHVGDQKAYSHIGRYSYVVLKKGDPTDSTLNWPRLVRPTLVRSKHAICRMCNAQGKLQEIIFTKSKYNQSIYRCARSSRWGDRLPIKITEPEENPQIQNDKEHVIKLT